MISHTGRRGVAARAASSNIPNDPTPTTGFACIKVAVAQQWQRMCYTGSGSLYHTKADKDVVWGTYLSSFPEGSNPIHHTRTEHDCSCCRQFIRSVGSVVSIVDGKLVSIWDAEIDHPAYSAVARAMSTLVRNQPIDNIFLHTEAAVGIDRNYENNPAGVKTWEHFFITLPNSRVCTGKDIGKNLSKARVKHDVLLRALAGSPATDDALASVPISLEAVNSVLDIIGQNSLYRGAEYSERVARFGLIKTAFDTLPKADRDNYAWAKSTELPDSVSMIRNTAIGVLLVDLSEGMDLVGAVRKFETSIMAPTNYKRPTALVTKAMVDRAKATVEELGLTSALDRRYATLADVSINNVLFADRSARKVMAGDVFSEIATAATVKPKAFDKVEEISVDRFLADVLPRATSLEVLVENRHAGNFVSLIAPADPKARQMFKWANGFSWSYAGDVTDSIKERVKKAGGRVDAELCCRLGWFNTDDLDLHMKETGGYHLYYGTKHDTSPSGGRLDVDMNVSGETREPVENIFYENTRHMQEGVYRLSVNSYTKREFEGCRL